jgi:hypothetical protein
MQIATIQSVQFAHEKCNKERLMKISDVVKEITSPVRRNDFEARRQKLGLGRVALGRILDVDPATVFRHERGPFEALWDYALRGVEADADKDTKRVLRSFKSDLKSDLSRRDFLPDQFEARGQAYLAERMRDAQKEVSRSLPDKARSARANGAHSDSRIKEIVDRAAARSEAERDRHERE